MRMIKLAAVGVAVVVTGCASVVNDVTQPMRIETVSSAGKLVEGVACDLNNDKHSQSVQAPGVANVRRSSEDLKITCNRAGEATGEGVATSRANAGLAGNIIIGGGIGALIDHNRGTAYTYPQWIRVVMGKATFFDRSQDVDGQVNVGGAEPARVQATTKGGNPGSSACTNGVPGAC